MKRNFVCKACGIVVTVSLLLTGCSGSVNTDATKNALLATETTAATEATKATTPKPTTKPATKPSTTKTTKPTGKTDSAKATEATKPAADQKPAASEPAATQKPAETPKPTNPPATEAPKPTNPPATNPPATEAPKPTNPPETQPPETEPALEPYHYDIYEAMEYGNAYAAAQGFTIDYSLSVDEASYIMTDTVEESVLDYNGGQNDLNNFVVYKIINTMDELNAYYGTTDWSVVIARAYVECMTSNGEPAYRIYFLYT